jgi:hypothetical protein
MMMMVEKKNQQKPKIEGEGNESADKKSTRKMFFLVR